ncbi:hypothetical protein D3C87_1987300 [compost metagenome]
MNENQSRKIGAVWARHMHGIHAIAADIGQFADIGIGIFELAGLVGGIADSGGNRGKEGGNFGKHGFNRTVTTSFG